MCSLCKLRRTTRNHNSTKAHRKALNPILRTIGKTRKPYAPRDWDAEAREAAIDEEFGRVEDLEDPGTDTYVA